MRIVDWTDERGRKYRVRLPDGAKDEDAPMGILIGPPDVVDNLGYPEPMATRLHNLLHERGLFNVDIVRKTPQALQSVLRAALQVDVHILQDAFVKAGMEIFVSEDGKDKD